MKNIILVSGRRCSGKTYNSKIISKKFNYLHIEMSDVAKKIRISERKTGLRLRRFISLYHKLYGKDFLCKYILEKKEFSMNDNIIISGIRNIHEYYFFLYNINFNVVLFYIHDSLFSRLIRTIKRKERSSILDFFIEEYYSIKWNDKSLRKVAIIVNKKIKFKAIVQIENYLKYLNYI